MSRDVAGDLALVAEHVVLEQGAPRRAGLERKRAQVEDRHQQAIEARVRANRGAALHVPPVVDEQVERLERLDVVPPEGRYIQGVARAELGAVRGGERLTE